MSYDNNLLITYLNLSDSIKNYSEEILDYAIIKPLIDCLKSSNISTLDLGFCNLKNEDIFLHLLSNISENLKIIHFEYNIEIKDINTFISIWLWMNGQVDNIGHFYFNFFDYSISEYLSI